jgi:hypothetical protein
MLAMRNDTKQHWVVSFHHHLYASGSTIVIEDWSNVMCAWTTISVGLLLVAPQLAEGQAGVSQTRNFILHD